MKKTFLPLLTSSLFFSTMVAEAQMPVATWSFDGTVNPTSVASITATNTGVTFVADRNGNAGKAAYFNGSARIAVSNAAAFNSSGGFSVAFWAKNENNPLINEETVFFKHTPGRDVHVYFTAQNKLTLQTANTSNVYNATTEPNGTTLNEWHHYASIYDGSNQKLYIDGILVIEKATSIAPSWTGGTVEIGSFTGTTMYKGTLDDLTYFARAITPNEIAVLAANNNDLLLYLPFDGNTQDKSSYNRTTSSNGSVTYGLDSKGEANKAMVFGPSNKITIPQVADFNNLPAYSISLYVKPTTYNRYQNLVSKESPNRDFEVVYDGEIFNTHFAPDAGSYQYCVDPNASPKDVWYHIVSVYNGTTLKLYKNGVEVKSVTPSVKPAWTGTQLYVGNNFTGSIDEVMIYKKALTPTEIAVLGSNLVTSAEAEDINRNTTAYPNPTDGLVNLPKSSKWSATNMVGDVVAEGNGQVIDLINTSSGIYYIQTESHTFKIIKK